MKKVPVSPLPRLPRSRGLQCLKSTGSTRAWALLAITAGLLLSALPAQAQWKWRGKDGSITVSDRPPPKDVADKDILMRPQAARRPSLSAAASAAATGAPAPTDAAAAAKPDTPRNALDREVEARKKAAEQEQAAKTKVEDMRLATQKAENCQRARGQQAALESGQRIARVNDKGEREVLDDKGRAEEMRQAREVIASDCR